MRESSNRRAILARGESRVNGAHSLPDRGPVRSGPKDWGASAEPVQEYAPAPNEGLRESATRARRGDHRRLTRIFDGGDIPVFPAQPPPETTMTRTTEDWLWLGAGFGMRPRLSEGFFVSPEVNFGASQHEGIVSAVIKAGYRF